jgi:F-type H+-transporting ATPase subunit b
MVNVDISAAIQIVNFLFLIWILNIVLYRPIRGVLQQRKERVGGLEERIETCGSDAQEKDDAYASGLRNARSKGLGEKKVRVDEASEEERRILAEINEKAQADLTAVRETIKKDAQAARDALMQEVDSFATEIGQKILGRAI